MEKFRYTYEQIAFALKQAETGTPVATRTRYGYLRIYIMLRREGWVVNHKRVYRLYRNDGLSLRLKKPRRNVSAANRELQPAALAANEMWSMGLRFRRPVRWPAVTRADRGWPLHPRSSGNRCRSGDQG